MPLLACIEINSRKRELFQKVSAVYFISGISRTNLWLQGVFCYETLKLRPSEEGERELSDRRRTGKEALIPLIILNHYCDAKN